MGKVDYTIKSPVVNKSTVDFSVKSIVDFINEKKSTFSEEGHLYVKFLKDIEEQKK